MSFSELGLMSSLVDEVSRKGYQTPTPIQKMAIPLVLEEHDLMGGAQTGTGKTAAFALPVLQLLSGRKRRTNHPRALVLAPTRELAAQVNDSFASYGKGLPLRSTVVFGGVNIKPQIETLRRGVDILVACPGRLLDLAGQGGVDLGSVEILILDEADRMLDMGFIHDIRRVLKLLPPKRQNLLFSATYAKEIRDLASNVLNNPKQVEAARNNLAADTVKQWVVPVGHGQKRALLAHLIDTEQWRQVLVFVRMKHVANRIAAQLDKQGFRAAAIHGNKSQGARTKALAGFKSGEIRVLVATDIAARGLDIDQLPNVVNFELPNVAEDYVHRIGRTGRAGEEGEAVSFVDETELSLLVGVERLLKRKIERKVVEGFKPEFDDTTPQVRTGRPGRPSSGRSARGGGRPDTRGGNRHQSAGDGPPRRRRRRRPAGAQQTTGSSSSSN